MPELPEAENIARALQRVLTGRTIIGVELFSPAMRTDLGPLKKAGLSGHRCVQVRRRGRYVVVDLDDGRLLLMHFGMSGVVRVEPLAVPKRKHEHVFLKLDDGRAFRFECTRRFSLLEVHLPDGKSGFPKVLDGFGPEPLTEEFSGAYLYRVSRKRKGNVKSFLMDNQVVAGIGNIYANETLFAAGIHPQLVPELLSEKQCGKIVSEAKRILTRAIEMGGSSISDFRNVDGSEGKFAQELLVYGREGESCPHCGKAIRMIRIGGRSSFYCPGCQKKKRVVRRKELV